MKRVQTIATDAISTTSRYVVGICAQATLTIVSLMIALSIFYFISPRFARLTNGAAIAGIVVKIIYAYSKA